MLIYPTFIFVVAAITFKVPVSCTVDKIIFEVAEITFKVASVAVISLLVAKINFAVFEMRLLLRRM